MLQLKLDNTRIARILLQDVLSEDMTVLFMNFFNLEQGWIEILIGKKILNIHLIFS